jgi:hypothetical protein
MDPFAPNHPLKPAHPFVRPHRVRKERKATGGFQRAYLFGGRKIGRKKGHLRHTAGAARRIEGKVMFADERQARRHRTRRLYARMEGAFTGNVVDPRLTRSRRIEREDK